MPVPQGCASRSAVRGVQRTVNELVFCSPCGSHKPPSEFYKNSRRASGIDIYCKLCINAMSAANYKKNKEKRKAQRAAWAAENPEKLAEYNRKWREANGDKARSAVRKSYQKHKEKRLAADKARCEANKEAYLLRERASYAKHKEARAERFKRWADKNKSKVAAYAAERRAARRQSTPP